MLLNFVAHPINQAGTYDISIDLKDEGPGTGSGRVIVTRRTVSIENMAKYTETFKTYDLDKSTGVLTERTVTFDVAFNVRVEKTNEETSCAHGDPGCAEALAAMIATVDDASTDTYFQSSAKREAVAAVKKDVLDFNQPPAGDIHLIIEGVDQVWGDMLNTTQIVMRNDNAGMNAGHLVITLKKTLDSVSNESYSEEREYEIDLDKATGTVQWINRFSYVRGDAQDSEDEFQEAYEAGQPSHDEAVLLLMNWIEFSASDVFVQDPSSAASIQAVKNDVIAFGRSTNLPSLGASSFRPHPESLARTDDVPIVDYLYRTDARAENPGQDTGHIVVANTEYITFEDENHYVVQVTTYDLDKVTGNIGLSVETRTVQNDLPILDVRTHRTFAPGQGESEGISAAGMRTWVLQAAEHWSKTYPFETSPWAFLQMQDINYELARYDSSHRYDATQVSTVPDTEDVNHYTVEVRRVNQPESSWFGLDLLYPFYVGYIRTSVGELEENNYWWNDGGVWRDIFDTLRISPPVEHLIYEYDAVSGVLQFTDNWGYVEGNGSGNYYLVPNETGTTTTLYPDSEDISLAYQYETVMNAMRHYLSVPEFEPAS